MKTAFTIAVSVLISVGVSYYVLSPRIADLGSTVTSTATSDTLETFRTNVNASLSSLQNDKVATTSAQTWTALQQFSANASSTRLSVYFSSFFGATATTTINSSGSVGIASSSPFSQLGIGTGNATSTIGGGYFCAYFQDEAKRGMWIKLSTSGNTVFSTSTTPCNQ